MLAKRLDAGRTAEEGEESLSRERSDLMFCSPKKQKSRLSGRDSLGFTIYGNLKEIQYTRITETLPLPHNKCWRSSSFAAPALDPASHRAHGLGGGQKVGLALLHEPIINARSLAARFL